MAVFCFALIYTSNDVVSEVKQISWKEFYHELLLKGEVIIVYLHENISCRFILTPYCTFVFSADGLWFMVFNTTFNNISVISWWSVLLMKETEVPGDYHRPATSH
jgi:hypothetical protein